MPTILNWPHSGEWLLGNPKSPIGRNSGGFYRKSDPPFAVLSVNFKTKTGTIRQWKTTAPISGIRLRQSVDGPKFSAAYAIGTHTGNFEATVFNKYELEIEFTGTAVTCVNAFPSTIVGGDTSIASWSTEDKLREATRRALPLMPAEVRREVEALFTPEAIAIMAGLAGLWVASHFAVIGEIADIALLITGGILLGKAAWDVGTHLAAFLTKAVGAESEADLDAAAQEFAAAVLLGGVMLVGTILMSNKSNARAARKSGPPARSGELPTEMNAVPPEKIPSASRAQLLAGKPVPQIPLRARLKDLLRRQQAGELLDLSTVLRPAIAKPNPATGRITVLQGSGRYANAAADGFLDVFVPEGTPRPPGTRVVSRGVPVETVKDLNLLSSRGNAGTNPTVVDLATRGTPSWDHLRVPKSALDAPMAERR